jgi:protein TonB
METRFVLPVVVATAFHTFVLLGVNRPHVAVHRPSPASHTAAPQPPFPVDLEPPKDSDADPKTAEIPPKGEPEEFKPKSDEPLLRPTDMEQQMETRTPPPPNVAIRISAGPVGLPDGIREGRADVTVFSSDLLDNTPRTKSQVAPSYPAAERSAGLTGEVLVEFVVDESGRVQHAHVVRSSAAAFESSTLRAVERWRFEPGKKNGRAVRFRMVVPVSFNLEA